ncbi:MAG: outer membrane beta-barrel protein [Cyclobacteriaceae bacterium]|nr:outer membrane beta-barrel protein [Cyclobacteriaceae bacterium]MDH5247786.1 outer membrane beta-barrel protein [Cyclobacteriaceae bacterium]
MKTTTLFMLCFVVALAASGQEKKRKPSAYNQQKQNKEDEKFLEKQWWLGFKAGPNLSKAHVVKTYSIIAPTNYEASTIGKKYDNFNLVGAQATIEVSFYFKRFLFSFQPTYQNSRFAYSNSFVWSSESDLTNRVELNFEQEQKLDHAILPLIIKYDIYGNRLRPYVQLGAYSAILINATKSVTSSGIDNAAGGENVFQNEPIIVGAKDLFAKSYWGLLGGLGVNYNLGNNVRLNLDIMYKYGMSNISSTENRYGSDRLSGVGDAMDDLTLDNLSVSIGCLFPMRFLSSGFKSLDH